MEDNLISNNNLKTTNNAIRISFVVILSIIVIMRNLFNQPLSNREYIFCGAFILFLVWVWFLDYTKINNKIFNIFSELFTGILVISTFVLVWYNIVF